MLGLCLLLLFLFKEQRIREVRIQHLLYSADHLQRILLLSGSSLPARHLQAGACSVWLPEWGGAWQPQEPGNHSAQRREDSEEALPPTLAYLSICHEKTNLIYPLRFHRVEGVWWFELQGSNLGHGEELINKRPGLCPWGGKLPSLEAPGTWEMIPNREGLVTEEIPTWGQMSC